MIKALREYRFKRDDWPQLTEFAGDVTRRLNALWTTEQIADLAITPDKLSQVPAIALYQAAAQSIANGVGAVIQLSDIEHVAGGVDAPEANIDPVQAKHHVFVRRDGLYRISGAVGMQPAVGVAAGSILVVTLDHNGAGFESTFVPIALNVFTRIVATRTRKLLAGDTVRLSVFQNTGNAQNTLAVVDTRAMFCVEYVGGL